MKLDQNFFQIFSIPVAFDVDTALIAGTYRELQKAVHPDKYAAGSDREQRLAVQYATLVNEAYATLKQPLSRAKYLLQLKNLNLDEENTTSKDVTFLMRQMEWREELADIHQLSDAETALENLNKDVCVEQKKFQEQFVELYKADNLLAARETVDKMQFLDKLLKEIELLEAELFD